MDRLHFKANGEDHDPLKGSHIRVGFGGGTLITKFHSFSVAIANLYFFQPLTDCINLTKGKTKNKNKNNKIPSKKIFRK